MPKQRYHSLSDFLISNPLTVDHVLDDGWGERFPVKGREIEAAILFADISGFSSRTEDFNPIETLMFVNNFLAWVTAEGVRKHGGIVDKYIGDEVMVVFSQEFGSEDAVGDALRTAISMSQHDALCFGPHFGIAAGRVVVGYTGTTTAYSTSIFGAPVALAARSTACKGREPGASITITFPSELWGDRSIAGLVQPKEDEQAWSIGNERTYEPKNLRKVCVRQLFTKGIWFAQRAADGRALDTYKQLWEAGVIRDGSPPSGSSPKVGLVTDTEQETDAAT